MKLIRKLISLTRFRYLLFQLVKRDFKIKYRGSVLGILWSVLNPLLNMLVLSVVFSQVFRAVDNYKMYLLAGLTVFNFFSEATNVACPSVVGNFGMITKVYFPKFIIPTSKVLTSSINLLITTAVYLLLGLFMDVRPWAGYLLIPYVLACVLGFSLGMAYILSALFVFFRDTLHLYGVLLTIWMYSTPILYPLDALPERLIPLFRCNPLYRFIDFFRSITMYAEIPPARDFLACAAWAAGTFLAGAFLFVRQQDRFIYYV
ncbi:MAG: ABC transporter permease [Acidaminococcaceae bacterium]|nr:ABC transporter permease [Acidaminococcaceae bacterium]